jgi:HAE1 family hydrophobic/amphiphilic exporter-1
MKFLPEFSVKNPVAVNLLMLGLCLGGAYYAVTLVHDFFPQIDPEIIVVTVAYPGSTPLEVEDGVTRKVEEAIQDVAGVEKYSSFALEGVSATLVELQRGANKRRILDSINSNLDAARDDFPADAEEPTVVDVELRAPVISVVVFGDAPLRRLKETAEEVEAHFRREMGASDVQVVGSRIPEVLVEIDPARLEQYNLTFAEVAAAIRRQNLDSPGGQIKASTGAMLARVLGEEDSAERIENIPVRAEPGGGAVVVSDVAGVADAFADIETMGLYKGKPAISLTIFKSEDRDAIRMSAEIRAYIRQKSAEYAGEAIRLETRANMSRLISDRQNMLVNNGLQGFVLVYLCMVLFLERRVAFWAAAGLPVSFLGSLILLYWLGETLNMISLFGMIIVTGMLVDDAIVIGENVYRLYENGVPAREAAVRGAQEVTYPVIAAILTSIIAFSPLMFIEGVLGDFLGVLPVVVLCALSISLLEGLVVLPSHLAESLEKKDHKEKRAAEKAAKKAAERARLGLAEKPSLMARLSKPLAPLFRLRARVLGEMLPQAYEGSLRFILHWRYVFVASMMCATILATGIVASGIIKFVFIQDTDSETVIVDVEMAAGTSAEETLEVLQMFENLAAPLPAVDGVFSIVGKRFDDHFFSSIGVDETIGQVVIDLLPSEERSAKGLGTSDEFLAALRERTPPIPGLNQIKFQGRQGGPGGKPIELQIRGRDLEELRAVSQAIVHELSSYAGVVDLEDDLSPGKPEARVELLPGAESMGLTTADIAAQARGAFFGEEAQSFQRAYDETKVRVRLNEDARAQVESLENFRVKLPSGERVPLSEVASVTIARGYGRLNRINGLRAVTVSADVDEAVGNAAEIRRSLDAKIEELKTDYPSVLFAYGGEQLEVAKSMGSLKYSFPAALIAMFILLAIQFGSYIQPVIVMSAIPLGLVGAVMGHIIMGLPFTIMSMVGIVALSGVVVNDSIVLVDFVNEFVRGGHTLKEAVVAGGRLRLRPIIVTSATTVLGLAPLIFFEKSFQAQFLIPLAVSLSFGLTLSTVIVLMMVPCLYMILEDVRAAWHWLITGEEVVPAALAHHCEERARAPEFLACPLGENQAASSPETSASDGFVLADEVVAESSNGHHHNGASANEESGERRQPSEEDSVR